MNNELQAKAKWVADLMRADGINSSQVTPDVALAYMEEIGRRIQKIQNTYLTRTGARDVFQASLLQTI